jgi:sulfite exporter TauE/SafE
MTAIPIITGLSLGILGSMHCVGMCGPIALSLPVHQLPTLQKYSNIFLYNIGRAMTYAIMGAILGLLGSSFQIFGLQQALSIGGGILILLFAFIYYFRPGWVSSTAWSSKISKQLGLLMRKEKSYATYLSIGILNGFLPCGLVYMALISAFATGAVWKGSLLMFFFGLGTLPMMAGIMIAGKWIKPSVKNAFKKIVPVWILALGIVMILRGMNLGIPYISPSYNSDSQCVEHCCEPKK